MARHDRQIYRSTVINESRLYFREQHYVAYVSLCHSGQPAHVQKEKEDTGRMYRVMVWKYHGLAVNGQPIELFLSRMEPKRDASTFCSYYPFRNILATRMPAGIR